MPRTLHPCGTAAAAKRAFRRRKRGLPNCGPCPACLEANRRYERENHRRRHRPDSGYVLQLIDATETRGHLRWLRSRGVPTRRVAEVTGLRYEHLCRIAVGEQKRVWRSTAAAVLAVGLHRIPPPPAKRWARHHDACIRCHRTDSRHRGRGLCQRCISRLRAAGVYRSDTELVDAVLAAAA